MKSSFPALDIPDISFSDLIKGKIRQFGKDIALVDNTDGRTITYKEIYDRINKLSFAFVRIGMKKGDVVGLCTKTCIEYPVVVLAILSCGATLTTCRTSYSKEQFLHQFGHTEPRFLVVCNDLEERMKEVAGNLPSVEEVFTVNESPTSRSMDQLIRDEGREGCFSQVEIDTKQDIAGIYYSSGTTGVPKGIMHTHRSLVSFHEIWRSHSKQFRSNCCYSFIPLCCAYGLQGLFVSLADGAMLVFDEEFDMEKMLQAVEKYKVSLILGDILVITALAKTDLKRNYNTSSPLQISCTGTTISPHLMDEVERRFDCIVSPTYGLTEIDPLSVSHSVSYTTASNGVIAANTAVKICDDSTGAEVGTGQLGNIVAKGPQMMKGYYKNTVATSNVIDKDGWLHTGDVGYLNKDGMVYVLGRKRELIKYYDTLISPAELENVLLEHPLILEAGVIGVPDKKAGEVPRAFVVVKDPALDENKVTNIVKDKLPSEKHLRGGVEFVDEIPVNFAGKIERDTLLKIYHQNVRN